MKKHYQSILGVAVGAAMLSGGCSSGDTVSGRGRAAASKESPLRLAPGAAVGDTSFAVSRSYLSGYFQDCAGRTANERWDLELSEAGDANNAPNNLRVAANDANCKLYADSIIRYMTTGHWDSYRLYSVGGNDTAATLAPILITDDYNANNVRVALPSSDLEGHSNNTLHGNNGVANAALVNVKGPGVSTFATNFNVHLLSGTSVSDLNSLATSASNLSYVSATASESEFPPSTYNTVDFSAGSFLKVDGTGKITDITGTFVFNVAMGGFGGTTYSYGNQGSTINTAERTDAQHYDYLRDAYFGNTYFNRNGNIANEGSFEIPIVNLFSTGTTIFDNDGHGTLTWNGNNYNTIVVRRVDGASNVASYQMFQIRVAAPAGTTLFPPATLTKFSQ